MINEQLTNPKSIVIVGGSNDVRKPGGKVLKNIIDNGFDGKIYVFNPKEDMVQGIKSYRDMSLLPETDLAILAIAAKHCPPAVELLARTKKTRAFIVLSAGFSEESEEGERLEKKITDIVNSTGACLIGPNCIGMMNSNHASVFTMPVPRLQPQGVDFISGSGAVAVYTIEAGFERGLTFSSVWSVGNSPQTGVEEVIKHLDENFDSEKSSRIKLLYMESIKNPGMLLKHASSLIRKGCRIAAIKSGSSEAGSRAATSHTGALAGSDTAVDVLFKKAGIVRCYGKLELINTAGVFMGRKLRGKRIAIITHAGGSAVMLTDILSKGGLDVPPLEGKESKELLEKLYPGSSTGNPIDFLATGNAEQLGHILDYCENRFDNIDGIAVIFGSPGLAPVFDVYDLLHERIKTCKKPIFPVLPSVINAADEIGAFTGKGGFCFTDEVELGHALVRFVNTPAPAPETVTLPEMDHDRIRAAIDRSEEGYMSPASIHEILDGAGIPRVPEAVFTSSPEAVEKAELFGYPVVMKVVGPVHKSDVGGVVLNIENSEQVVIEFERMMKIPDTTAVLMQPMLSGKELFAGVKAEMPFGHMVLCGLGGIFVEVFRDVKEGLIPLGREEAISMIGGLKGFGILKGVRGERGVDLEMYADILVRLSAMAHIAPEIVEMDINPLLGSPNKVIAVDARVRIEKTK